MPEVAVQREALPSVENIPPSPGLRHRIATGIFDTNVPIDTTIPSVVHRNAFDALENQNIAKREEDAKTFAQKMQNPDHPLSPEEIRSRQMISWSIGIWTEMNDILDAKQEKLLNIFANPQKLGLPVRSSGNDLQVLLRQFYDDKANKGGAFYEKFCTGNMNEKLAHALTVDEMMQIQTFLKKWMLGSDTAFNALVTLRQTMDDIASSDTSRKQALAQAANSPLSERDEGILAFFRKGEQLLVASSAAKPKKLEVANPEEEKAEDEDLAEALAQEVAA